MTYSVIVYYKNLCVYNIFVKSVYNIFIIFLLIYKEALLIIKIVGLGGIQWIIRTKRQTDRGITVRTGL